MDPILIAVAFAAGFAVHQIGLPPLVGYLVAGFALGHMGFEGGELLSQVAEIGVVLLLFSIGLKLKIKTLFNLEVWAGATVHMAITVAVFGVAIFALSAAGFYTFAGLGLGASALIAFAMSYSSTVFAVKVLDDRREMQSLYGRVAIGILIVQDIVAVVFITLSYGKSPSLWALALFILIPLRPVLFAALDRCGRGELVPLFGLFATMVLGAAAFDLVGLKADLGALILGVLLSGHARAEEISDSLLSFKDLFLVGFFLNIGLAGTLSLDALFVALLLVLVLPLKMALFFFLLTRFRLRARSSWHAMLSLATYSEFGLIVGGIGVTKGWITPDWLAVIAIALSITFVLGTPLSVLAKRFYSRHRGRLVLWESATRHPDEQLIETGDFTIAILGMGRIGTGAYDFFHARYGEIVIGLESNPDKAESHKELGRNVILTDAADLGLWERLDLNKVQLVMLALPQLNVKLDIVQRLADLGYGGRITAVAHFPDEIESLKEAGVHAVYDAFVEAGAGFAGHVEERFAEELPTHLKRS